VEGKGDDWILGIPFLTEFYTIYDMTEKKIGLVKVNKENLDSYKNIETGDEITKGVTPIYNTGDEENCESNESCLSLYDPPDIENLKNKISLEE